MDKQSRDLYIQKEFDEYFVNYTAEERRFFQNHCETFADRCMQAATKQAEEEIEDLNDRLAMTVGGEIAYDVEVDRLNAVIESLQAEIGAKNRNILALSNSVEMYIEEIEQLKNPWQPIKACPINQIKVLIKLETGEIGIGWFTGCKTYNRMMFNGTSKALHNWKYQPKEWMPIHSDNTRG